MTPRNRPSAHRTAWLVGLGLLAACNFEAGERALQQGDEARAAEIWQALAQRGDMRARLALGRLNTAADATPEELEEAEREFTRVVRLGEEWQEAWARYELGQLALRRDQPGVAAGQFEAALRLGVPWAGYALGQLLAEGRGMRQDPDRALRLTARAASAGVPPAMTAMGDFYTRGVGVAADLDSAREWYRDGAEAGDPWAHYALAQLVLAEIEEGRAPRSELAVAAAALEAALAPTTEGRVEPAKRALADLLLPIDAATAEIVTPDSERALALYESAAAAGDPWARFRLADILATGRLGTTDPTRAAELYGAALKGGVDRAATVLGWLHETGTGVAFDPERAAGYYARASADGDLDALLGLTRLARLPDPPAIDTAGLLPRLEAALDERPAEAAQLLGEIYLDGDLVAADPARAAAYLERALEAGDTSVRPRLAALYRDPDLELEGPGRDARAGRDLLEAATAEGDPNAAFELARLLETAPVAESVRARSLYTAAAEAGVEAAKKALADQLRDGIGGPRDRRAAIGWYEAAAAGDPWAAYELARLLEEGPGVSGDGGSADPGRARDLYAAAAASRIVPAKQALADMLREGRGGAADPLAAARWYRAAAEAGEPWAAYELGRLYAEDSAGRLPADRPRQQIMAVLYRSAAEAGIPQAQLALADLLAEPDHSGHDPEAAALWYERAAASGEPMAAFRLARLPTGTAPTDAPDPRRLALLEEAVAAGVPGAATELARLLEVGPGDPALRQRALDLYREAAAEGDPWAALALGRYYQGAGEAAPEGIVEAAEDRDGSPGPGRDLVREEPDAGRAARWLEQAAAAGLAEAERRLGDLHADPEGDRFAPAVAASWYAEAAAKGDQWAMLELAKLQIEGPAGIVDPAAAARSLQPLAEAGVAPAQKLLGDLYDRGRGVVADPARALALHRDAASAGDPWAALVMAERHAEGRDVPRDRERAREFYLAAAVGGLIPAQRWLAADDMARATASRGEEAEAARASAITWYRSAAEGGDAEALYRLALLHLEGQGVSRNPGRAVSLLERAAAAGSPEAGVALGDLYTLGGPVARDSERANFWYRAAAEARARDREARAREARDREGRDREQVGIPFTDLGRRAS